MHQHTHLHAFTPILHLPLTSVPAAPMGTEDFKYNSHIPRGTTRPSFAPVTAFHRATQTSFPSAKRGKWGALHVCIAWKIYYQEQQKKLQQKPNSLCGELTPEHPTTSLPESVQHKDTDQTPTTHPHPDSPCGQSEKTDGDDLNHFNRGNLSDLNTSSPCHSRKKEELQPSQNQRWNEKLGEKEKKRGQQAETPKESRAQTVTPELCFRRSSSLDRKRQLNCNSFIKVKRAKQDIIDNKFDSSLHTDPFSQTIQVQHMTDLSALYLNSSRCNVTRTPVGFVSYPRAEMHHYQTASWEPVGHINKTLDLHSRQNALKDFSVSTYKAIRIPLVAQRQKEALHSFFAPPLCFPLTLRQQELVYLRGKEFLHACYENDHLHCCRQQLPHPGFLAASYLGP